MENNNPQTKEEVLIARNNETGQVGAVVGQNTDGTPQMTDAKSAKLSDLVKFSKGQSPLEAFMSNFLRQVKNPSLFGFFKVPAEQFDTVGKVTADLAQDAEANKELLAPYKVTPEEYATKLAQEQGQQAAHKPKAPSQKPTVVDESKINWQEIEQQWGISKSQLEESGALKAMLYNHKAPGLFTVKPTLGGQTFEAEARLSFRTNADGSYTLTPHFIKNEPKLDIPFKGHEWTKEEKEALLKNGNLGKPVELTDPKTGVTKKYLVSIDRLTNEIESIPADKVYVKNKIGKTELSMKEISILKDGGVVRGKEIELNNGRKFTSDLQYNADKRDVEFLKAYNQKQSQSTGEKQTRNTWVDADGNPKRITKWKDNHFSEQQIADYVAGKQVKVAEITDKKGLPCTVFIQFDKERQRPVTKYSTYAKSQMVGVANESKTQYAVNNQGKTNEATKKVGEPLQKGQTQPKNEQQEARQKKKGPKL